MRAIGACLIIVPLSAFLMASAHAEEDRSPYLTAEGGLPLLWTSTNEQSGLEGGERSNPLENWRAGLALGYDLGPVLPAIDRRITLKIEGNLIHQQSYVHGANDPPFCQDPRGCSADDLNDNHLRVTGLLANAIPGFQLTESVSLYGLGGLGPAHASALDDHAAAFLVQGGGGVSWNFRDAWLLDIGPRVVWSPFDFDLAGQNVEYLTITPILARLSWRGDLW